MWLSCDWFLPRDGWPSRRLWRKLSQQTVDDRVVSWTLSPHDSSLCNFFVNYSLFSSFICSGSRCPCGEYCNNKKFQRVRLASYFSPSIPLPLFFPSSSFLSYPSLPFPPSSLHRRTMQKLKYLRRRRKDGDCWPSQLSLRMHLFVSLIRVISPSLTHGVKSCDIPVPSLY